MSFNVIAITRWDGLTQQYGPYTSREQAEKRASGLRREAQRNAPFLSPETNAAFDVQIKEVAE